MTTEPEHTAPDPSSGLTAPLTAADAAALGDDAELLAGLLAGALHGVALLRTGGACAQDLAAVIEDVGSRLPGRDQGLAREAAPARLGPHVIPSAASPSSERAASSGTRFSRRRASARFCRRRVPRPDACGPCGTRDGHRSSSRPRTPPPASSATSPVPDHRAENGGPRTHRMSCSTGPSAYRARCGTAREDSMQPPRCCLPSGRQNVEEAEFAPGTHSWPRQSASVCSSAASSRGPERRSDVGRRRRPHSN